MISKPISYSLQTKECFWIFMFELSAKNYQETTLFFPSTRNYAWMFISVIVISVAPFTNMV